MFAAVGARCWCRWWRRAVLLTLCGVCRLSEGGAGGGRVAFWGLRSLGCLRFGCRCRAVRLRCWVVMPFVFWFWLSR